MFKTALIVDDSRLSRINLKRRLEMNGIKVSEAENVYDAENWIQNNEVPEIIFLDIMMPEMDGFQGLSRLRTYNETKNLPIVMYSGLYSEEAREKAKRLGANSYLPKPADPNQVLYILDTLYRQKKEGTLDNKTMLEPTAATKAAEDIEVVSSESTADDLPNKEKLFSIIELLKDKVDNLETHYQKSGKEEASNQLDFSKDIENHKRIITSMREDINALDQKLDNIKKIALAGVIIAIISAVIALISF